MFFCVLNHSHVLVDNYKPADPVSLSVSEPFLINLKPSVTVTWDPGVGKKIEYIISLFILKLL